MIMNLFQVLIHVVVALNKDLLKDSFYLHSDTKNKLSDDNKQMHLLDWLKINKAFEQTEVLKEKYELKLTKLLQSKI